jgi:hypothetical protein
VSTRSVVFIDANQYLYLYETIAGKKLIGLIHDQREHILVTPQIVDEVYRNKVNVTARFMADWLKKLELNRIAVADHLLSTADDRILHVRDRLQAVHEEIQKVKEEFKKLTHDLLAQVSQSKDEVSTVLTDVFSRAIPPNDDELQRARDRRERGNAPGKPSDPLGDQLNWEQLLTHCKDKPMQWIITRDFDYGTVHEGKMFLNAALHHELSWLYQAEPSVSCFDNLAEGLRHFVEKTGAKVRNLPTLEETEQIKKEQESLPRLDWLGGYDDSFQIPIRIQDAFTMMDSVIRTAARASQLNSEEVIPPPPTKQTDKDDT